MGAGKAIKIAILADARRAREELSATGAAATRLGSSVRSAGRLVATAFAGAAIAGVVGLGVAIKAGVQDAIAYEAVQKQAAAALKATGSAAGQTLESIKKRAAAIETLTGATQDENDVITAQSRLLRAGLTSRDAFNQATLATANLAAASGQNISAASKVMTKALQDPTKAAGALRRANVVLSESQQDQIKKFVEAGEAGKAQAIVLDAVNKQLGGAAAAQGKGYAATIANIKDTFQDFARDLGTRVLPSLQRFADVARNNLPRVLDGISAAADRIGPLLSKAFDGVAASIPTVVAAAQTLVSVLGNPVFQAVAAAVLAMAAAYKAATIAMAVYSAIQSGIAIAMGLFSAATRAATLSQLGLNAALLANPIGLVVLAIVGLIAAFVVAYKNSETFRNIVNSAMESVKNVALAVWNAIKAAVDFVWPAIQKVISVVVDAITTYVRVYMAVATAVFQAIKSVVDAVWPAIRAVIGGVIAVITTYINVYRTVATTVWTVISAAASVAWNVIKTLVAAALLVIQVQIAVVRAVVTAVWTVISTTASAAWGVVSSVARGAIAAVLAVVGTARAGAIAAWNAIKAAALAAFNAIPDGVRSAVSRVVGIVQDVVARIRSVLFGGNLFAAGAALIQSLANGVASKINAVVDKVRAGLNTIKGMLPGSPIKHGPLKNWNNGGAGKRLMNFLIDGIQAREGALSRAAASAVGVIGAPVTSVGDVLTSPSSAGAAGATTAVTEHRIVLSGEPASAEEGRRVIAALAEYTRLNGPARIEVRTA